MLQYTSYDIQYAVSETLYILTFAYIYRERERERDMFIQSIACARLVWATLGYTETKRNYTFCIHGKSIETLVFRYEMRDIKTSSSHINLRLYD